MWEKVDWVRLEEEGRGEDAIGVEWGGVELSLPDHHAQPQSKLVAYNPSPLILGAA